MALRIHAIVLALNEEPFIENQLRTLYPFCCGISVITQYDRDWYGKPVQPDDTVPIVLKFPDPHGKVHLVIRRFPDEAAARNSEMLSIAARSDRHVIPHCNLISDVRRFHAVPDYFLVVDADEFYDTQTFPKILDYLGKRRPRGMRVNGINYVSSWNRRVPLEFERFCHFGFVQPGILFEMRRTVSWNESRFSKLLRLLHLPDFSARMWGFIECPPSVGVFHHAAWVGDHSRLVAKAARSSHPEIATADYPTRIRNLPYAFIPTEALPQNIRDGRWPLGFFE